MGQWRMLYKALRMLWLISKSTRTVLGIPGSTCESLSQRLSWGFLASLVSICVSCQGLVLSKSSCLRPFLGCLLLATEHYCYRLHPSPTWSSSIARSPALVGLLFSYCFPATKSALDGLFSWLQSFWYTFPSSYPRLRVFAWQFLRP